MFTYKFHQICALSRLQILGANEGDFCNVETRGGRSERCLKVVYLMIAMTILRLSCLITMFSTRVSRATRNT